MVPHRDAPRPAAAARRTPDAAGGTGAPPAGWRPWRAAWVAAAYGPAGFWSRERPADHFATGVGVGPLVARAVAALVPPGVDVVVDVGAGDATLLSRLADLRPGLGLVAVDRRPRPEALDARVRWRTDHWDVDAGDWADGGPEAWLAGDEVPFVVAHEWLDDLPATVALRTADGWCDVEVDGAGAERPGRPVSPDDATWLARWWPGAADGARAEVGRTREVAWAALVRAAVGRGGRALAVDYGHVRDDRPAAGSLVAYAGGRQRRPVPDGSVNLTAGVAVDALAAAGEARGARTLALRRQADVLADVPTVPEGPVGPEGTTERHDPLASLVDRSERAALTSPDRWGGLWWLLQAGPPVPVS